MIKIIFEPHSTSEDNENQLSSGWNDVDLSKAGVAQAKQLGRRYKNTKLDAIFASDLKRARQTATLAFGNLQPNRLYLDWRLREINYGEFTQHPKEEVDIQKPKRISEPFPDGESYEQAADRMRSFLEDLLAFHDGRTVMVIGHRATQYGLDYWLNARPLLDSVTDTWKWQPGWHYDLKYLPEV